MDVLGVLGRVVGVDLVSADVGGVRELLADLGRVESWVEARRVAALRRLEELRVPFGATPEQELATAGNSSRADAVRVSARSRMLDELRELETALQDGEITGAHVDVLDRGLKGLDVEQRERLLDVEGDRLACLARSQSPEEFIRSVRDAVAETYADGGLGNLGRQKRAMRLAAWTDRGSGMVQLRGQFDPESGLTILGRLRTVTEDLFSDRAPETCPADPQLKQDHLRALALVAVVEGTAAPAGRPDLIVVVDEPTLRAGLSERSIVDLGADTVLPVETLRRVACSANIIPAVLNADGVLVDLGRSARLASRAQRRAMRTMYASCAVPGCRVVFEQCVLHHIRYWEHGGSTDLINMLPVCSQHHHAVHEGGWQLTLEPVTRQLTITLPDGTIHTTGPPRARAG